MDNLAFKQVQEALGKYNNIGIAVGKNTGLDSMAAALGLYLALTSLNKTVSVVSAENPTVEVSSLVGINRVKTNFQGEGGDLTVSFPYKEGEIDKASYTLENGYLNIIIKAGEQGLSFNQNDVKFTRSASAPELLFIIGTPRLTDLGQLFDPAGFKNTVVVNIDKSPENQNFGDVVIVSPSFSSVSEIVASLLQALGFRLEPDTAQNLMQGIQNGTGNFQNPNTSPLAFEMAGYLIRHGASRLAFDQSLTSAFARSTQPQPPLRQQPQPQRTFASQMPAPRVNTAVRNQNLPQQDFEDDLGDEYFDFPQPQSSYRQPISQTNQSISQRKVAERINQVQSALESQVKREETIERKEQPGGQNPTPPEDWLTPKIYKGSTNF